MGRREPGEDCIRFSKRMGRKDQVFTITTAAFYFGTRADMVSVPSAHGRDETTGVAEIPAQSGAPSAAPRSRTMSIVLATVDAFKVG